METLDKEISNYKDLNLVNKKKVDLIIDMYFFKSFNKDELLLMNKNLLQKKQEQINYFSNLLGIKNNCKTKNLNIFDFNLLINIQSQILDGHEKIVIKKLAKKLLISRTQLHRKITMLTGLSITKYINIIRIEKAKSLLKNTTLNSNEIAYEVGFESATYFSRIFKKQLGVSPVSFRNNQQ